MAAFRILNNFPAYLGLAGKPASGGELRFYESGTTTPKSVYGGPGLSPDNGSTVALEVGGRTAVDVWGDGSYRVRLYDADGTLIAEADDVEIPGGDATTIPALVDGYFLTNNGALLLWAPIRQLPDPTGQDGKMVVADGDGYILQSVPTPPTPAEPEIVVSTDPKSFQAGTSDNTTKYFAQYGSGSAPATGTKSTSVNLTWDEEFSSTPWFVSIMPSIAAATPSGALVDWSVTGLSSTGCTVNFNVSDDDNNSSWKISNAITFLFKVEGTKLVVPEP